MREEMTPGYGKSNLHPGQHVAAKIERQFEGKVELSTTDEFLFQQRAVAEWLEGQNPELGLTYLVSRAVNSF